MTAAERQERAQRADLLVQTLHRQGHFNGNVLLAENGQAFCRAAVGTADFATGRKLDEDSVFDLASLSKAFTAMAIMILHERGALAYDDTLEMYFKDFPYKTVTVRDLLNHTSGLPDYIEIFLAQWDKHRMAENQDVLDMLYERRPPFRFAPGTKWEYSNTGYVLLALLVERVSEKTFSQFLRENIFGPLQMDRTAVINPRKNGHVPDDMAIGYIYSHQSGRYELPDALPESSFVTYMDGMQGDGSVNSTIGDLLKWDQALYTEKLVRKATLDEAFTSTQILRGEPFGYGFGWGIMTGSRGKILRHSGGWPGYKTTLIRYIDRRRTLIVLCNVQQPDELYRGTVDALEHILFGEPYTVPSGKTSKETVLSGTSL